MTGRTKRYQRPPGPPAPVLLPRDRIRRAYERLCGESRRRPTQAQVAQATALHVDTVGRWMRILADLNEIDWDPNSIRGDKALQCEGDCEKITAHGYRRRYYGMRVFVCLGCGEERLA